MWASRWLATRLHWLSGFKHIFQISVDQTGLLIEDNGKRLVNRMQPTFGFVSGAGY
jgi:hypothetical protein